jgi:hypothetical protein
MWRPDEKRVAACSVLEVDAFGGGSVKMSIIICLRTRMDLYVLRPDGITFEIP